MTPHTTSSVLCCALFRLGSSQSIHILQGYFTDTKTTLRHCQSANTSTSMILINVLLESKQNGYTSETNGYISKRKCDITYHKTSNIKGTLIGNKIVEHSDAVGASPVGAASTTSSFSTQHLASIVWAKTTARRDEKHLCFCIRCALYYRCDGNKTEQNKTLGSICRA